MPKASFILGISGYYHDSAAALIQGPRIVAAAEEERFSRKKHDASFPEQAVRFCLAEAGISVRDLSAIVFYEKPLLKFDRLIETYLAQAPRGVRSFITSMPAWIREKLHLKAELRRRMAELGGVKVPELPSLLFTEHHQAHAASAFFPSPFEKAAVLCLDGVGEWATSSLWLGERNQLRPLWELRFPHSLGLLYSAFTGFAGFKVNSGEYKLMGLAPYGEPRYVETILRHLLDLKEDGTFRLRLEYFDFLTGFRMISRKFEALFGGAPRQPEGPITQREKDLARSIQVVTEEIVLRLARTARRETGAENLCLAGGVALNCVANGRLLRDGLFQRVWVQPASGDSGAAVGAALSAWHQYFGMPRPEPSPDGMAGALLGPSFTDERIEKSLRDSGAVFERKTDEEILDETARLLADGKVVGWFQGRMEFGPRALGNRSILGDPRNLQMQSIMNLKIKFRESFRPFAPAVLRERASEFFDLSCDSPYMLFTASVADKWRGSLPAVTHVDGSARIQTVDREINPRFHGLLSAFERKTGCPVLVNTSFNVRGEPVVCTPEEAYRCFLRTEIDALVLGNALLHKHQQPAVREEARKWTQEFSLD